MPHSRAVATHPSRESFLAEYEGGSGGFYWYSLAASRLSTGTAGIYFLNPGSGDGELVRIRQNTFEHSVPFDLFPAVAEAAEGQVGIEIENTIVTNSEILENTFTNLHYGVSMVGGIQLNGFWPYTYDQLHAFAGNTFTDCAAGIAYPAYPSWDHELSYNPNRYTIWHWPSCNTFNRSSTVPGVSVGIWMADGALVTFNVDHPTDPNWLYWTAPTNLFNGQAPAGAGNTYYYLRSETDPAVHTPRYVGFASVDPQNTQPSPYQLLPTIAANSFNVFVSNADAQSGGTTPLQFKADNACGVNYPFQTGFGHLRTAGMIAGQPAATPVASDEVVGYAAPNPAYTETTIQYQVAAAAADLIVRDILTGTVVLRQSLDTRRHQCQVDVSTLRAGVYAYSVVADGVVLGTRRLVVQK